jgi:hypothetical protein
VPASPRTRPSYPTRHPYGAAELSAIRATGVREQLLEGNVGEPFQLVAGALLLPAPSLPSAPT